MPPITDIIDLGQLGLKPGGGTRFDAAVRVGDFVFGRQHYELADDPALVTVDISRTTTGYVIRVRAENALQGPCMRCFGDLSLPVRVDHSEVHEPHLGPDLASEYVSGNDIDLAALVRDAIGLALPATIASPVDENGVCTLCENSVEQLAHMRDEPSGQAEPEPDPRWAKLRELEL